MKKRDPFFDVVKFFAMFMVVLWHTGLWSRPPHETSLMANFIVSFNMPIFYLVSVFFSRRALESGGSRKLAAHLIVYFWPLFAFAFIAVPIRCFLLGYYSWEMIPIRIISYWIGEGWFFYTLAWCEVITFVMMRIAKTRRSTFFLMAFILGILLLLPIQIWNVDRLIMMLPFYWLGVYALQDCLTLEFFKKWAWVSVPCFVIVIVSEGNCAYNGMSFYSARFNFWNFDALQLIMVFVRWGFSIVACVAILVSLRFVMAVIPAIKKLSFWGTSTLRIYYIHFLFLACIGKWWGYSSKWWISWGVAIIVYLLSHLFYVVTHMQEMACFLIWGDPEWMIGKARSVLNLARHCIHGGRYGKL